MCARKDILIASAAVVLVVAILGVSPIVPSASATSHSPSDVIASENVEPNDGFGNATNVTDGYYADLEITEDDSDFYAVELDDGDELEASIYFSHDTGDLDMRVYDGTGEPLVNSTSTSDNETITFRSDTGGTYFVEVYGFIDATAPYDLEIRTSSGLADAVCSLSDTEVPPGSTVFLDASDSDNVDLYTYDREGDGDPEAEGDQDFRSFPYNESGTYRPRVVARNFSDDSRDVAECGELVVDANENPNANLTSSPTGPAPGETVTFDPSGTSDPDGDRIVTWEWDLDGDGVYEDLFEVDETRERNFSDPGTYTVGLRVTDEYGASNETTVTVDVQPINEEPSASFSYLPESLVVGEEVNFDASESADPDGEIESYEWTVDGDPAGSGESLSYNFDVAGEHEVGLTVTDDDGATASTTRVVTVESEPVTCSVEPREVVVGEQIAVQASGGATDGVEIDFQGDESYDGTTTDGTVTHRYESAGEYVVLARADTTAGPEVVECGDVTVEENQPPEARLTVTPSQPRPGETVTLDASESTDPDGTITEYRWDVDGDDTVDRTTNASSTTIEYTEETQLDPAVTVVDDVGATDDASEPIRPFVTRCAVDPRNVSVGDTVTIDASDSEAGFAAQFDVDGDGEYEYERDSLSVQHAYNDSESYDPQVLVIGETREVLVDCPAVDVTVAENQPPVARLDVTPSQPEPGDTVTLDAGESTDPDGTITEYRWDVDGDGTIDRTTNASSTTIVYTEDTQLDPAVTVVDDGGATGNASGAVDTGDVGSGLPVDPESAAGLLGLLGFGGVSYYLYAGSGVAGGGASGGKSRPPRPPKRLPEGHGLAHIETGTVSTPIESGSVSVTDLGFEPDLILLSASNVTPEEGADPATDRTDGWAHGKVRRAEDGTLLQSTMTLADDDLNIDAGIGGANDGHALELLVHYDDPPERVLGSVTSTTTDGFEISFDTSGLRENHSEAEFTVLYKAFGFQGDPQVSVGHFRTPDVPGTQTIDLGVNADHVVLFATNTIDDVDSHLMTDLPLGFSVGDVIGHGAEPAQLVRTATADPSVANSVAYAAYDDRALHLQYGYDGTVRGRTTATVTALAEGRMNLEYQKVYHGPNKLGSTDSKLVSYVAMNTGDVQPAIGHFRLPEPGSEEALAVELGFRPSMVEFQSFAIYEMNAETVVDAPVSFGWSEGTVIADDGDIRHQVLDQTIGASRPSAAGPRIDPGFAASVRTVADGGKITGRDEVTVTRLTESGFEMAVTDVGTAARTGGERRPLVFYKAWPRPIGSDSG